MGLSEGIRIVIGSIGMPGGVRIPSQHGHTLVLCVIAFEALWNSTKTSPSLHPAALGRAFRNHIYVLYFVATPCLA